MKEAAAIVTDRGGRTCHAALVSRELGVSISLNPDAVLTTLPVIAEAEQALAAGVTHR